MRIRASASFSHTSLKCLACWMRQNSHLVSEAGRPPLRAWGVPAFGRVLLKHVQYNTYRFNSDNNNKSHIIIWYDKRGYDSSNALKNNCEL